MRYAPIEDIDRCEKCAKRFILAGYEELLDNKDHPTNAYNPATGVKELVTLTGVKHYGVYNEKTQRCSATRHRLVPRTPEGQYKGLVKES